MRQIALMAIQESIAHWERNEAAPGLYEIKIDTWHCALCRRYFNFGCVGCPVAIKTRRARCGGTPYHDAERIYRELMSAKAAVLKTKQRRGLGPKPRAEAKKRVRKLWKVWRMAARREVEFLKSVLETIHEN